MKKIIFNIVQSNIKGGLENIYLDYTNSLNKDFKVICITSKNFIHLEEIKKLGIKTETLNIKGHFDFMALIKFYFLVKKYSPKIIIAHNGRSFSIINFLRFFVKNKNFKTIAINHGGNPKRLINFDYIITVARHLEKTIKRKYPQINPKKIITIHNGITVNDKIINKVKNKDFTFGTLSRLSPEKNIITIIKAFKNFNNKVKNSKLIIGGEGPELKKLTDFVQQNNLDKFVLFKGHTDKTEFFSKIDVLLHSAVKEPFGLVIIEAFNNYTPVIGVKSGGLEEIIEHNYNGFLYDNPESDQNLFKAMSDYYFNKIQDKEKIISNAYKTLTEKFSLKVMEKNLISFIRKLIQD